METELINLTGLVASKDFQHKVAQSFIDKVNSGEETAINMAAKIKLITDTFKEVSEAIKSDVIIEVAKFDKSEQIIALNGYSVTVKEMGAKYDYSCCNHPKHKAITLKIESLEKEQKIIEEFLKSIRGHVEVADEDTGEIITVYPPSKKSTTTPVFTFKK